MDAASGETQPRSVLVTGGSGYVGRLVVRALARAELGTIVSTDVLDVPEQQRASGVHYRTLDIRAPELVEVLREHAVDTVVHLAAVVTPRPGQTREEIYAIDVEGTGNVVQACVGAGVTRLVYTSSGAAYGYHEDSPPLLREDHPLRGNREMAYAWHKRLVEELLEQARAEHPELGQLVLRVSTIVGASVSNAITALFERPVVTGLAGVDTPFCFIWDQDLVDCIVEGALGDETGIYNITGDGVMTLREIARSLGRPYLGLPGKLLERALSVLHDRGVSSVGPEAVLFLRHRPVLCNRKLKQELGFCPQKTSREAFELYRQAKGVARPVRSAVGTSRWERLGARLLLR